MAKVAKKKSRRGQTRFSHGAEHFYTLNEKRIHMCSIEELQLEAKKLESDSLDHLKEDVEAGVIPPAFKKKFLEAVANNMIAIVALHFYPKEYGLVKGLLRVKTIKALKQKKIGEWK